MMTIVEARRYIHRAIDRYITRDWDIDRYDDMRTVLYDGTAIDFDLLSSLEETYIKISFVHNNHIIYIAYGVATENSIHSLIQQANTSLNIFNKFHYND